MSRSTRGGNWSVVVLAVALDTCAILPVGLVGAFALHLQTHFEAGPSFIGATVGCFFVGGSLTAAVLGWAVDRVGPRIMPVACGMATATSLLGFAVTGQRAWGLPMAGAVGGAAFALTLPATNAAISRVVPHRVQVLTVCCKQASVPLALTAGSAVVTVIGDRVPWQTVFLAAALFTTLVVIAFSRLAPLPSSPVNRSRADAPGAGPARQSVIGLGIATGLASLLPGALAGFALIALVGGGADPSQAAVVIGISNVLGIVVRVLSGLTAQQRRQDSWTPVGSMMIFGGIGAFLLATGSLPWMYLGTLLAFGLGWGWSGLMYGLVLVKNQERPGSAGAVLQAGGMLGTGLGPIITGWTVEGFGLGAGWAITGTAIIVAGTVVLSDRLRGPGPAPA